MKLLLDENLAPRLAKSLSDLYPGSARVRECGLSCADDSQVWAYAKAHGFVIVSKDSDFEQRGLLEGPPAKFVRVRLGNCTTGQIEKLLRDFSVVIHTFYADPVECVLVLP